MLSARFVRWFSLVFSLGLAISLEGTPARAQTAATYRAQGLASRQAGELQQALQAFQQAATLDPATPGNWILLGWTYHLADRREAAATALWRAIALDARSREAWNAIGIVYLVRGDLPQAILAHSWAALSSPNNEIAHYNLSLAYQRQQLYDWAIAHGLRAADLEPSNPHPYVALAIAYWEAGDRDRARSAYNMAVMLDSRYRAAEFLSYLDAAGFSPVQIRLAQTVLAATE